MVSFLRVSWVMRSSRLRACPVSSSTRARSRVISAVSASWRSLIRSISPCRSVCVCVTRTLSRPSCSTRSRRALWRSRAVLMRIIRSFSSREKSFSSRCLVLARLSAAARSSSRLRSFSFSSDSRAVLRSCVVRCVEISFSMPVRRSSSVPRWLRLSPSERSSTSKSLRVRADSISCPCALLDIFSWVVRSAAISARSASTRVPSRASSPRSVLSWSASSFTSRVRCSRPAVLVLPPDMAPWGFRMSPSTLAYSVRYPRRCSSTALSMSRTTTTPPSR